MTGEGSRVPCCKEQYCIGTLNVRSMNQSYLEVVKQEMARVNINFLGISELKWTGMDELNLDDHYIYYCGQESLRRNGIAIIVNKSIQNAVLGCNLKNDRMISVCFQGKPFNITVIQVHALKIEVGKTTRPFRYDLNQIPYNYTVEVTNRFKGLGLIECLKNYERRFMTFYRGQ